MNFPRSDKRGARARAQIDNNEVTSIVNSQSLITVPMRIISRKLVFSSCSVVALSSRFSFFSKISRIWGRINLAKLTTFERYSRPIRKSSQKSRLVEGPCRAHSGAVSYALPPRVPHGSHGATTRKRAGGPRRGLRVPLDTMAAWGREPTWRLPRDRMRVRSANRSCCRPDAGVGLRASARRTPCRSRMTALGIGVPYCPSARATRKPLPIRASGVTSAYPRVAEVIPFAHSSHPPPRETRK